MKKALVILATIMAVMVTGVALPAGADAPHTHTFNEVNDEHAVDPCTGDPMVVELEITQSVHQHERMMLMHAQATGATGDYELHHSNLVMVETANKLEGRLVELYNGPDGSKIRVSIRATIAAGSPPNVVFRAQCLTASTGS